MEQLLIAFQSFITGFIAIRENLETWKKGCFPKSQGKL